MSGPADAGPVPIGAHFAGRNGRDVAADAARVAEPNGALGPCGPAVAPDRAALAARFRATEAEGVDWTKIDRVDLRPGSDAPAIADLATLRRLGADASVQDACDSVYVGGKGPEGRRRGIGGRHWQARPATAPRQV